MKQRVSFVAEASKPRANISRLCREFGISRQVGYKLLSRYETEGLSGVAARSRRPQHHPKTTKPEIREKILALRAEYPYWGATLLHGLLADTYGKETPCVRTVERILDSHGLLLASRRPRGKWLDTDKLIRATAPNHVWTTDFKGWWRTRDRKPCFPLTVRDAFSRCVLGIVALKGTSYEGTREAFEALFEEHGLPDEILSDNGTPFASVLSVQGLTRLSAWWVSLGIRPRRILPACPFMNGSHERMHRDMKRELQRSPAFNRADQQKRFDEWRHTYNVIRPNQALQGRRPAVVYKPSSRRLPDRVLPFEYPDSMERRKVSPRGLAWWHRKPQFISGALAGETIGLLPEKERLSVWYCELKLGITSPNFDFPLQDESTLHRRGNRC